MLEHFWVPIKNNTIWIDNILVKIVLKQLRQKWAIYWRKRFALYIEFLAAHFKSYVIFFV